MDPEEALEKSPKESESGVKGPPIGWKTIIGEEVSSWSAL
jgi:hypothetical protein